MAREGLAAGEGAPMELASIVFFAAALFVAAATPGPGIAAIVARVLARGPQGALAFTLGVALGDVVWLSLAVAGLAVLAQTFHWLFVAVKWAGVAYLLFLAWRMWRAPVRPVAGALPPTERRAALVLAGLSVTMGNPKVMVFYLALLPSLVDVAAIGWLGYAELVLVIAAVLAVVFSAYVLMAARARSLLATPAQMRRLNRGSALAMAGAAGWVAAR
jgi:threonine/homoserine/homoserine lactone efflux protein